MIRPAKFFDTVRIVELMDEMHARSRYKDVDVVDAKHARSLVAQFIHRHGGQHDGGSYAMVSVRDQKVEGFILGILDRTYHIGKKLMAQDVLLYLSDKADKLDAQRLLDGYIKWAADNPKVVEIKLSWTDAIPAAAAIEALYERKGFRRCGAIWTRGKEPQQLEEAA